MFPPNALRHNDLDGHDLARGEVGSGVARTDGWPEGDSAAVTRTMPEVRMLSRLPVHRRARMWYGARLAPAEPAQPPSPYAAARDAVPALRIAKLPIPLGGAPIDRRPPAFL